MRISKKFQIFYFLCGFSIFNHASAFEFYAEPILPVFTKCPLPKSIKIDLSGNDPKVVPPVGTTLKYSDISEAKITSNSNIALRGISFLSNYGSATSDYSVVLPKENIKCHYSIDIIPSGAEDYPNYFVLSVDNTAKFYFELSGPWNKFYEKREWLYKCRLQKDEPCGFTQLLTD